MIRIGYFGDGPWASLALDKITAAPDRFQIAFITPRYDTQDPALKEWAEKLNVSFLPHENVNDPAFLDQIRTFGCDVLVSMSFNQILKTDIIHLTPHGFINCHAGALPFYRGRNPLNWALINDEKEFGITVHYVDEGIDTGDIIRQNMVPISQSDTYASLLDKAFSHCPETLMQALDDIARDTVVRTKQETIHPVGFYCGRRRAGDEIINWIDTSRNLYNFIRAITLPGPGARTTSAKGEVAILSARMIENSPTYIATCGEVVGRRQEGCIVKTGDTTLLICEIACIDANGALAKTHIPRWPIGTRLGL